MTLTPRILLAAAIAAGLILLGRCTVQTSAPLPKAVQAAVDRHLATSIADTVTTHRLERVAAAAVSKAKIDSAARDRAETAARVSRVRADSLAAIATLATTAADSATAWQRAYVERTHEADSLTWAVHLAGVQLETAATRQAATDSILTIWKAHALRADTVIVQLLPLAQRQDRCRILWRISCPSRTQTAVAAVVTTIAVGKGWIRLPVKPPKLPF